MKFWAMVFTCLLFLAVTTVDVSLAGEAKQAPKTGKTASGKASADSKEGAAKAGSIEAANEQLKQFADILLLKSNNGYIHKRSKPEITQADGKFIAKFTEADRNSLETSTKTSDVPGAKYIGTIIYNELVYVGEGKTAAEAAKGPFEVLKGSRITEIYRYMNNKWVN